MAVVLVWVSLVVAVPAAAQNGAGPGAASASVSDDPKRLLILLASLTKQQRFDDALPVAQRLVQIAEQRSGPRHPDTALTLAMLASIYRSKGDIDHAQPLFQRSYDIYQALTPDGPQTVPPLLNLGLIAKQRGNQARAVAILRRALAIQEKARGANSEELFQSLHALEQVYLDAKDNAGAAPWFLRELAIVLQVHGETSEKAADTWHRVALLYEAYDWRKAVDAREHVLAIQKKLRPANDPAIAETLERLARLHSRNGEYLKSASYYQQLIAFHEGAAPPNLERVSVFLGQLGIVYRKAKDHARAQAAFERSVSYARQATPRDEKQIAIAVSNLAEAAFDNGNHALAESLLTRELKSAESGGDAGKIAMASADLARLHARLARFDAAEAEYQHACTLLTRSGQLETVDGGNVLDALGSMYVDQGAYEKAQPLYEQAVAIAQKVEGPRSGDFGSGLNNLARVYMLRGDLARAERDFGRALEIFVALYGPEHPQVATVLNNLGSLAKEKGDYAKAKRHFQQALDMEVKADARPEVLADIQTNLGWAYLTLGDYQRSEQFYKQALATFQGAFGPDHFKVGMALNNLGTLYESRGDSAKAKALFARSLAIAQKQPGSPQSALTLINLAATYDRQNDFKQAESLGRRGLALLERSLGPNHPGLGVALLRLASIRAAQGDLQEAEALLRRGIALVSPVEGGGNLVPLQASLADVLAQGGKHEAARPLYAQAVAGYAKVFGADHPDLAKTLVSLGVSHWAMGDATQAINAIARGSDMREREVAQMLSTGSEEQRRAFLAVSEFEANAAVTLSTGGFPTDLAARRLALLEILRRKGRVLDAMSDTTRAVREHLKPADRPLFDRLKELRTEIARRTLLGPPAGADPDEQRRMLARLQRDADEAEAKISQRSDEFRSAAEPVTFEHVVARLPAETALVEIVSYRWFDPRARPAGSAWGARRYAAFVLHSGGKIDYADLGERSPTDALVGEFRTSLDSSGADASALGHALYDRVMRPIVPLLGGAKQFLLAPDGDLALIPFAALIDEKNRYLIDAWSFSYLSSGRDLLRSEALRSRSGPLVVANPAFSAASQTPVAVGAPPSRSGELARAHFDPLPGTEEEGRAILGSLRGASFLTGIEATTSAIAQLKGPRVLHVATHGFFLSAESKPASATRSFQLTVHAAESQATLPSNPLLRSGLAFAGANLHRPGDNGILTALEASSLDLWGTRLVVLSACETGVGEVKNGEGVYGLRRALVLAGAESLVMSLWKVDDAATRDLMIAYYRNLELGQGRFDALRNAQRRLMQRPEYRHPHFWASFVGYGSTAPLGADTELPPAVTAGPDGSVPPAVPVGGARGCGCHLADTDTPQPGALLAFCTVLALSALRRRRQESWR